MAKRKRKTGVEFVEVDPITITEEGDIPRSRTLIGYCIDWDEINANNDWQDSIIAEAKERDRKFRELVASGMSEDEARKIVRGG